jgi:hypothetical protein
MSNGDVRPRLYSCRHSRYAGHDFRGEAVRTPFLPERKVFNAAEFGKLEMHRL